MLHIVLLPCSLWNLQERHHFESQMMSLACFTDLPISSRSLSDSFRIIWASSSCPFFVFM